MKGATMLATLQGLGIMSSFSRPAVSNDNPYSESQFKTLKYRPKYPLKLFDDLAASRQWVTELVKWYNQEHRHSAIRFVTSSQSHAGLAKSFWSIARPCMKPPGRETKNAGEELPGIGKKSILFT